MTNKRIYLDYNATTPINPDVAKAMWPYIQEIYGNPSSAHWFGVQTKMAVEKARKQIASFLNCSMDEIVFTSGGTESNNTALKGIAEAHKLKGNHIITSMIEHPAILEVCRYLERNGFSVSYIPVDNYGLIDLENIKNAITSQTILISIMHANNEVGTIQPIKEISALAKKNKIFMHTDAAQSAGKIPLDVEALGVDLLSLAGHKLYAPKGIGALYLKRGTIIEKFMHGADHERNLRAGTENVLEIIGLGKACELAADNLKNNATIMQERRDRLHSILKKDLKNIHLLGHPEKRLPNTLNIGFAEVEANTIISELENVAVSAGAACHADQVELSHVLTAMKIPEKIAMGAIRFSTSHFTTKDEITTAGKEIVKTVSSLQKTGLEKEPATSITEKIKLTHFTHGLGCACKIQPQILEKVLKNMPIFHDENILIDQQTNDDAAVYRINDNQALLGTVDFFTPIVDDPYYFGAIAAANSLSDIYAMGGTPLFAMNIVGFPTNRLPVSTLEEILKGAYDKAKEAGIGILGGHTIDDTEPKFGMAVLGIADPGKLLRNSNARPGDVLILTKPIGTGIISTAIKKGIVSKEIMDYTIGLMAQLNKIPAEIARNYPVSACTDITGFGLLGHLMEMTKSSKVDASIFIKEVPLIDGALEFAESEIIPGGSKSNLQYVSESLKFDKNISYLDRIILADAQTSGGLLFSLPEAHAETMLKDLKAAKITEAKIIGKIDKNGKGFIHLIK